MFVGVAGYLQPAAALCRVLNADFLPETEILSQGCDDEDLHKGTVTRLDQTIGFSLFILPWVALV